MRKLDPEVKKQRERDRKRRWYNSLTVEKKEDLLARIRSRRKMNYIPRPSRVSKLDEKCAKELGR